MVQEILRVNPDFAADHAAQFFGGEKARLDDGYEGESVVEVVTDCCEFHNSPLKIEKLVRPGQLFYGPQKREKLLTDVDLWHFQGSHFCEKARWALDFKGIPHTRRTLGASYLPRAWWRTGRGTLPVLWLGGRAIGDSTRIIEALERYRAEPPLYPEDPAQRARCLELAEFFDEELGHPLRAAALLRPLLDDPSFTTGFASLGLGERERRVFRAIAPVFSRFYRFRHQISPRTAEAGHTRVVAALDRIDRETQPSGYLVGDAFSVADLTAAALLGAIVRAPNLEYPLPEPLPDSLNDYCRSIAAHPAAKWVLGIYARHRGSSAEVG